MTSTALPRYCFTFNLHHSIITGAAIALLDGVYLPLHISGVSFKVIGYGMPRVCILQVVGHLVL
jgi:hypothetical protein